MAPPARSECVGHLGGVADQQRVLDGGGVGAVGRQARKRSVGLPSDVMKERGLRSSCPSRARMLGVLTLLRRRRPL
jgi:hypothetical protein